MMRATLEVLGVGVSTAYGPVAGQLIAAIEAGEIAARSGYLVGLDRPALLSPDPAALMAARRSNDILASGHRWRVVTASLWEDLLALGRERPVQRVHVVSLTDLETWLVGRGTLADLERDGWRGDQGTRYILPVLDPL